jgi:CCR4-NOT transcriptional regulation complex NOT5 subunit
MKNSASLFNGSSFDLKKPMMKGITNVGLLKPAFFTKFTIETLFYIFYFMPRDSLQICAAEELYKRKWRYHAEYCIWFVQDGCDNNGNEVFNYFNFNEWKVTRYSFNPVNKKLFLSENEVLKYFKALNIEK